MKSSTLILTILFCLGLCSCSEDEDPTDNNFDFTGAWQTTLSRASNDCPASFDALFGPSVEFDPTYVVTQSFLGSVVVQDAEAGATARGSYIDDGNGILVTSNSTVNIRSQTTCKRTTVVTFRNADGDEADASVELNFNCRNSTPQNCSMVWSGFANRL